MLWMKKLSTNLVSRHEYAPAGTSDALSCLTRLQCHGTRVMASVSQSKTNNGAHQQQLSTFVTVRTLCRVSACEYGSAPCDLSVTRQLIAMYVYIVVMRVKFSYLFI